MNVRLGELKIKEPFSLGELKLPNVTVNGGGYERGYEAGYDKGYDKGNTDGYAQGQSEGYEQGYESGNTEGYNKGQTEGYNNGYEQGYSEGALPIYYLPTMGSRYWKSEFPEGTELSFRFKNCIDFTYAFCNTKGLKRVKIIVEEAESVSMSCAFRGASSLEIIELSGTATKWSSVDYALYDCTKVKSIYGALDFSLLKDISKWASQNNLEDISFVPETIKVSIPCQFARYLTKASITSIIGGLSPDSTEQTLTLSTTAVNKAFETAEGANDGSTSSEWETLAATKPNWTIALV